MTQVRRILDRGITYANALDRACTSFGDRTLWTLDAPLAWRGLENRELSAPMLRAFAARMGHVLRDAGMQRGDRVAVYKSNAPDYVFLSHAIVRAGGISVPINAGMGLADLRRYLDYVGAKLIVSDAPTVARLGDCESVPVTWVFAEVPPGFRGRALAANPAMEAASAELEPVVQTLDSEVLIAHTSGTTGNPKGVIATVRSLVTSAKRQFTLGPVTWSDRVAVAAPFNHMVCHVGLLNALLGGIPTFPLSRQDAVSIFDAIERNRITILFAFPDIYGELYGHGLDDRDLSSMRIWLGTADVSHDAHKRAFAKKGGFFRVAGRPVLGSVFMDSLGSSEIAFAALSRSTFFFSRSGAGDRLIGTPNPAGPRVKVADEHGKPVPAGQVGRLMMKGPTLFKGYWNAPDHPQDQRVDGWWWTGDLVRRDRLGRFYHLDRAVDVIRAAAGPIYSLPTEDLLMTHEAVFEAAVFAVQHPVRGSVAVAMVVLRQDHTATADELRAWANQRLVAPAQLDDLRIVSAQQIPRGVTGKVLKRVLREREAAWFTAPRAVNADN